jgi:DNA ligase (NAD+)
MDIVGMGINTVRQMIEAGLLTDLSGMYHLTKADLMKLDGFGEKKADNLLAAIDASKTQPLARLINALGIRGVGEVAAQDLANHYSDLDALSLATSQQIETIEGFGPSIAENLTEWFASPDNHTMLARLKASGVWPVAELQTASGPLPLGGLTFVITGTLPSLSRSEAKALIEQNGGKVTSSVSKNTSYLVLGADPGSKFTKAQQMNIPTLSEMDLQQLIKDKAQ